MEGKNGADAEKIGKNTHLLVVACEGIAEYWSA